MQLISPRTNILRRRSLAVTAVLSLGLGTAFQGSAAPTISGASGDVRPGAQITISGSGFGSKSKAAPLVWDTVDNFDGYKSLSNGATVPEGKSAVFAENAGVKLAKAKGRASTSNAHYYSNGGNVWFGHPNGAGGENPSTSVRELFLSYWVKFPQSPFDDENNASHKFVRIRAGDERDLRISWTQRQVTVSNNNAGGTSSIPSWNHTDQWAHNPSGWHLHEMWISVDQARVRTWVDGQLRHDWHDTDSRYLKRQHPAGLEIAILGWNPSHGTKGDLSWQMDDIHVDNTQARVLLSNAARWSDSRAHEFQPAVSWSDKQITFNVNPGQLDTSKPVYIYVVNPSGEVNSQGYPAEGCKNCPKPPTNLNVE